MTRPAEYTRQSIMKAAVQLFAEKGYQRASVRDIVAKARVNQAAINYHFKGKDGLYLELLKMAFDKLTDSIRRSLSLFRAKKRFAASCTSSCGRCCFAMSSASTFEFLRGKARTPARSF